MPCIIIDTYYYLWYNILNHWRYMRESHITRSTIMFMQQSLTGKKQDEIQGVVQETQQIIHKLSQHLRVVSCDLEKKLKGMTGDVSDTDNQQQGTVSSNDRRISPTKQKAIYHATEPAQKLVIWVRRPELQRSHSETDLVSYIIVQHARN